MFKWFSGSRGCFVFLVSKFTLSLLVNIETEARKILIEPSPKANDLCITKEISNNTLTLYNIFSRVLISVG